MLLIMLARTLYGLAFNTTTIETWEIERHETLLRRARAQGGWLQAPDGSKVRIERQEFPWDVGVWRNVCQGMGTGNVLAWVWPFAGNLDVVSGLVFEHNEIEGTVPPRNFRICARFADVDLQTRISPGRLRIPIVSSALYLVPRPAATDSPAQWTQRTFDVDSRLT